MGIMREVPSRHGRNTDRQDVGPHSRQWPLRAGQLPLGHALRTDTQPSTQGATMKVRLLTGISTGSASHEAGDVLELDDTQAEYLVEIGIAVEASEGAHGAPEAAAHQSARKGG